MGKRLNSPAVVTYAYRSTDPGDLPDDAAGFSRFSAAQIVATKTSLAAWAGVANITFVRVNDGDGYSDNATMLFSNYQTPASTAPLLSRYLPSSGFTGTAGPSAVQGDIYGDSLLASNQDLTVGGSGRHARARDRPRDRPRATRATTMRAETAVRSELSDAPRISRIQRAGPRS